MAAQFSTIDAILRDDYKTYVDNLNNKAFLLAQIKQRSDKVQGRRATHSVHLGRSGAIGFASEMAALPTADQQRYNAVQVPIRMGRGRIQLSIQLIDMAKGDPGSFVDALEGEMQITNDVMRDVNRQLWGTSNGVIATCGVTTASTTVVLATSTSIQTMRHLYVGRQIDIGTVASPFTIAQARNITALSVANKTITISGGVVTTSGIHFVFNTGAGGASTNTGLPGDGQIELTGMQTIVSTTAILHTIDPSVVPAWSAQVYNNSGTLRSLAETQIDIALMAGAAESGESANLLVSNFGVFVAGKAILTGYQRNIDTLELPGGFKGIKWSTPGISGAGNADVTWYADFDAPANMLFGINSNSLVFHQVNDGWRWMDQDGAILSRVAGFPAYEAVTYTLAELACVRRNCNFLISDLIEAS